MAAVVLLLTLPFIRQPFNQDDRDFVEFARASANDITSMRLSNCTYDGRFFLNFRDPHAPLLTTFLGSALRLGGAESETLFHSLYLIFPLIAALSFYFLAMRFTRRPMTATMLLLFTPGALVLSHTLMDNFPGLALSLAAAALYIYGADRNNIRLLAASGAVIVLAALTAYQSLSIVPALAFYGLAAKPRTLKKLLPFTFLLTGGMLWLLATYKIYGRLPAISYRIRGQAYQWPGYDQRHGIEPGVLLTMLGGVTVFPLSLLIAFMRRKKDLIAGAVALVMVATWVVLLGTPSGQADWFRSFLIIALAWAGLMTVYKLVVTAVSTDARFLFVWFASALGAYLFFLIPYVSARHLLLLFPPIILLFVNEAGKLWPARTRAREAFLGATLVMTLAGALAAAIADYDSASVYPAAAVELGQQLRADAGAGGALYYRGEFGFRYYLEQQGFQAMSDRTELHPGDLIVFSEMSSPARDWPEGTYTEAARLEPGDSFPFRVWNLWAGAGFYTDQMGSLPIVVSRAEEDQIIVYRYGD